MDYEPNFLMAWLKNIVAGLITFAIVVLIIFFFCLL